MYVPHVAAHKGAVWLVHLLRSHPNRPPKSFGHVDVAVCDILNPTRTGSTRVRLDVYALQQHKDMFQLNIFLLWEIISYRILIT